MEQVSVRELKARLSEIIRRVDERREPVEVTRSGKVIVRIEPASQPPSKEEIAGYWSQHKALAEKLSEHWIGDPDAETAVHEQRRNLTPDEWVSPDWRPST